MLNSWHNSYLNFLLHLRKKKVFCEELEELICKMLKTILLAGLEGDIDSMGTPPNETPKDF